MPERMTGQIMTRPVGGGKVMIFGILSVDEASALLAKDGRQFIVCDQRTARESGALVDTLSLVIQKEGTVDHDARGETPGSLLIRPIWRV